MSRKNGPSRVTNGRFAPGNKGGPGRRKRADTALVERGDGWLNVLSGYGTNEDKRTSNRFGVDVLSHVEAADLWRGNDSAAVIVEDVPAEMYREGIEFTCDDDELCDAVNAELDRLAVTEHFRHAKEYERAYGGAAIFPVINDSSSDLAAPLNEQAIPEIRHLQLFEPCELVPQSYYTDILNPKFGEPELYQFVPIGVPGASQPLTYVHESRLITSPGIRVTRRQIATANYGWGDSILTRVWTVLSDHGIAWTSVATMLHEWSLGIMKMEGLVQLIGTDKEGLIKSRLGAMMLGKSSIKSLLLDTKDEFTRQQPATAGLADLIDRFWVRLAAAARMPVTRLCGQAPAGLSATGEGDQDSWYDTLAVEQHDDMPRLRRMVQLILRSRGGPTKGREPENWQIAFKSLWQMSDKETADARKVQAEADKIYIDTGVLDPDDVAESRFGAAGYSYETKIDWARRAKLERIELATPPVPVVIGQPPEPDKPEPPQVDADTHWRTDMIELREKGWVVLSSDGKTVLGGPYQTKGEAVKRLRQVEAHA